MISRSVEQLIESMPGFEEMSTKLSRSIHSAVLKGGEPARKVADLLHGTWLGHPLHPVMTDFAIGGWGMGALFDVLSLMTGEKRYDRLADAMIETGTIAAVPTLITGLADYSTVKKPASAVATLHALLNDVNFALYLLSIRERRRGNRGRGVFFSMLGTGLMLGAAWLGGHLVYNHKMGVDHSDASGPEDWTPALSSAELPERTPVRVELDGNPILLYRYDGRAYAINATCSHAGGPLDEGSFDGCYVECPWHQSVIDVRDGSVRHGPATRPQPVYAVREQDGSVEVRLLAG